MNNIVKKILDKFDSGENLNEEEVRKLLEYELEEFRYEGKIEDGVEVLHLSVRLEIDILVSIGKKD